MRTGWIANPCWTLAMAACLMVTPPCLAAGPDVIVGDLPNVSNYAASGGIDAFAIGTTSCNIGDEVLIWIDETNQHPVIGQNMYRLKDGRFEQVGISWLKHGFTALQEEVCSSECEPNPDGTALGVNCSDPYTASLNGSQDGLGPRYEVNAYTGEFPYPPDDPSFSGSIARRLQVKTSDLESTSSTDTLYFVEGQYIHPDDAAAGNGDNNVSHRRATISVVTSGVNYSIALTGSTERESPAIEAWRNEIPEVTIETVRVEDDGLFMVGWLVTENLDGTWHYEYAVYNMNSDRSGASFSVPLPIAAKVTNVGFNDVDYHSGEPFDGADWSALVDATSITWSVAETYDEDEYANAIRWGTLYNFRFDCDAQATTGELTLGLFKPALRGGPDTLQFEAGHPDGDFIPAVRNLHAAATADGILVSWINGGDYSEIELERDGELIELLDGDTTYHLDLGAEAGSHVYTVTAYIDGNPSVGKNISAQLPAAGDAGFAFVAGDQQATYSPATGHAEFAVELRIAEDSGHAGYPNPLDGFSMALVFDPLLIEAVEITPGAALDAMNDGQGVDFFAPEIWPEAITLGVLVDFEIEDFLSFAEQGVVANIEFETNSSTLDGANQDLATVLEWRDGAGNPKLLNYAVSDSTAFTPRFVNGVLELAAASGDAVFLRGDVDGSGSHSLTDAIQVLRYMFSGGDIACEDAGDFDDSGSLTLVDAIQLLQFMFSGGDDPQAPFPDCSQDPTADTLGCDGPMSGCP